MTKKRPTSRREIEKEAAEFYFSLGEGDRKETRAFQAAAMRSLTRRERPVKPRHGT